MSTDRTPKLLDEVCDFMRLHHYSIRTEHSYYDWIRRYIKYHIVKSRNDLVHEERKVETFLTHLAVDENASPSTQYLAMNALVF
jgi:hypothetical protein